MKALPKILLALTAVAALSFAYPASVQAVPTTYVYTGNPFTSALCDYTTSDFVTAMVTLAAPLADNMALGSVTPLAFTLSDGVQTFTINTATTLSTFRFQTDASGVITGWDIEVFTDANRGILTVSGVAGLVTTDGGGGTDVNNRARNRNAPGEWTVASVPDAGSSIALLSLSITALGVAARRFKRAAA
jgi:hypothetical protein